MVLLRRVIGDTLRSRRLSQHRTLREVSTGANVSLGYLSEIERGQKEASSELLASICEALDVPLSQVLREVSDTLAVTEERTPVLQAVGSQALTIGAQPAKTAGKQSSTAKASTPIERSVAHLRAA
ncbi:helix-turn-helix domain-containing protein [Longispora albida]|uniref:helix-turn-helix domain-containing protein n=1 Tax=Longispora albida TaxID=203523 RepID=UPI00036FB347|nr:helix-turn-helix transcriptional regulator [Longispora albida]